jgi:2',3'-cyclic-nucleotide 2'-phosphodiesterase (5'-nucleotidase family)
MTRITLLHTNDIHGRVHQLARISGLVKQIKQETSSAGGYCFYLDAGDSEDTVLLECSLTKGSIMGTILRAAGCDVMTMGNALPIRYGAGVMKAEADNFGQPILCANLLEADGSPIAGLEPYRLLQCGNLKIAVIGLTAPLTVYESLYKLQVFQPEDILADLVKRVHSEGAQFVIALNHLASPKDLKLAEMTAGLDVIIGGHDHQILYPPRREKDCLVVQAGEHGKYLGRLNLDIDDRSGRVLEYSGELIPVTEDLPEDEDVVEAIRFENLRTEKLMSHIVGKTEFPIDLAFDRECAAGDLLADALVTRFADAQFSIVLAGHWSAGLPAGEITARALFSAIRSTANPARVELTGSQVVDLLKKALQPENAARELHALRGIPLGWPHVSGLELAWDGRNVDTLEVFYNGVLLDPKQKYFVVGTDTEFSDGVDYLVLPDEFVQFEIPTIIPEVLQDYLSRLSPLKHIKKDRIRLR